ncbi:MAG: DNA internalization-related competence protein ComEC/Rec2 [Nitrospirota bacterium]|nr:DNA internalization-related competence protein ComEC/Rec2 [Nitrospirota bacterium]
MPHPPYAPLLASALAVAAGIALGEAISYFPFSTTAFLVSICIATFFLRHRIINLRQAMILAGCLFLGIALHLNSLLLPHNHVAHLPEGEFMLEGTITSFPEGKLDRQSFILDADRAVLDTGSRPVSGKVRISMEATPTPLHYGDRIRLTGRFHQPSGLKNFGGFDYENYLKREGIHLVGSVRKSDRVWFLGNSGNAVMRSISEWRDRIRSDAGRSLSGPGRAVFIAMTIGDERFVNDPIRDAFMVSGTTHILSISGSHVGLIAFLLYNMVRLSFRLLPAPWLLRATLYVNPSRVAALATIPIVIFYTLLAGAETPTVRSAIMVVIYLTAILIGRGSQPLNSLALAALLTFLFDPQALFSISFQLSFLTVLLICLAVEEKREKSLAELLEKETWKTHLRQRLSSWLRMSVAASLGTLPLVACYFNSLPWVGIIANSVIVPLAGFVVVPVGLFSAIIGMAQPQAALPFATFNQHILDTFYRAVNLFAAIPGAEVYCPSPSPVIVMAFFSLLAAWYFTRSRLMLAGTTASCLLFLVPFFTSTETDRTVVDFIDVGQGDCALVRLSDGKTIMVDTGGASRDRFDMGRSAVAPFLRDQGIRRLDLVILSHYNADHAGGMPYLMRHFEIGEIWEGIGPTDNPLRQEILRRAWERRIPVRRVKQGDRFDIGGSIFEVLNPPAHNHNRENENSSSIVVRITAPDMSILFAGDADETAESAMHRLLSRTDVIKVAHHGSRTSSSEAFLALVRPVVAVVSVGRNNNFGHPVPEVMMRYSARGSRIYRTDRHGIIRLTAESTGNSRSMNVITYNDRILRETPWADGVSALWRAEAENIGKMWRRPWLWEGKEVLTRSG